MELPVADALESPNFVQFLFSFILTPVIPVKLCWDLKRQRWIWPPTPVAMWIPVVRIEG